MRIAGIGRQHGHGLVALADAEVHEGVENGVFGNARRQDMRGIGRVDRIGVGKAGFGLEAARQEEQIGRIGLVELIGRDKEAARRVDQIALVLIDQTF